MWGHTRLHACRIRLRTKFVTTGVVTVADHRSPDPTASGWKDSAANTQRKLPSLDTHFFASAMTDHSSSRSKERGHPMLPADVSASAHSLAATATAVTTPPVLTTPLLVNSSTAALASAAVASVAALVNDTTRNASIALGNSSLRLVQSITDDPNSAAGQIDTRLEKQNIVLLMFVVVVLPVLVISACCCFKPRMPWMNAEPKNADQ